MHWMLNQWQTRNVFQSWWLRWKLYSDFPFREYVNTNWIHHSTIHNQITDRTTIMLWWEDYCSNYGLQSRCHCNVWLSWYLPTTYKKSKKVRERVYLYRTTRVTPVVSKFYPTWPTFFSLEKVKVEIIFFSQKFEKSKKILARSFLRVETKGCYLVKFNPF